MFLGQGTDYKNNSNMQDIKYIIFDVSELPKIDFSVVLETSQYTVRKSVNQTKTFVSWNTEEEPFFIEYLDTKQGPYTYDEILEILKGEEWFIPHKF